jgi:hypothetical protein
MIETADRHDGGCFRLREALAGHRARSVDDERHIDGRARLIGLRRAALQGDAQIILLCFAALHDGQGEPRIEADLLASFRISRGRGQKKQAGDQQAQRMQYAVPHGQTPNR